MSKSRSIWMTETFGTTEHILKRRSLKTQLLDVLNKTAAYPLNRLNGQELTLGEYYRYGLIGGIDRANISPNQVVSIRTSIVLAGSTLLILRPDLADDIQTIIGESVAAESITGLIEASVKLSVIGALFADRLDGDVARMTDQCSKDGETLDADADKVCVHVPTTLALVVMYASNTTNPEAQEVINYITGAAAGALGSDFWGSTFRPLKDHKEAWQKCWKPPLTEAERAANRTSYTKSPNAAAAIGKIKTVIAMAATAGLILPEDAQTLTGLDDEAFWVTLTTMLTGGAVLATASASQKYFKTKKA